MPQIVPFEVYTLTVGGGTINLDVEGNAVEYYLEGNVTLSSSYTIQETGTPVEGMTFIIKKDATVTTNVAGGIKMTVFLQELTDQQALTQQIITARYDGAAWVVNVEANLTQADIIENANMAADSVDTAEIVNLAVDGTKIANLAVDTAQLAANAVDVTKIANLAVDTGQLAAGAVTTAKIDNLAVDTAQIAATAVDGTKIAALAVDTGQLAANAVTTAKIDAGAVTATELDTGAVGTTAIADSSIREDKLTWLGNADGSNGGPGAWRYSISSVVKSKLDTANNTLFSLKQNDVIEKIEVYVKTASGVGGDTLTIGPDANLRAAGADVNGFMKAVNTNNAGVYSTADPALTYLGAELEDGYFVADADGDVTITSSADLTASAIVLTVKIYFLVK